MDENNITIPHRSEEGIQGIENRLNPCKAGDGIAVRTPKGNALKAFDHFKTVAKNPAARGAIAELIKKVNLNLWLNFREGMKGGARFAS